METLAPTALAEITDTATVRVDEQEKFEMLQGAEAEAFLEGGRCPEAPIPDSDLPLWQQHLTEKPPVKGHNLSKDGQQLMNSAQVLFYAFGSGMDSKDPPQVAMWSIGTEGCTQVEGFGCIDVWWAKESCVQKEDGKTPGRECDRGSRNKAKTENIATNDWPMYSYSNLLKMEKFGITNVDIQQVTFTNASLVETVPAESSADSADDVGTVTLEPGPPRRAAAFSLPQAFYAVHNDDATGTPCYIDRIHVCELSTLKVPKHYMVVGHTLPGKQGDLCIVTVV